MRNTALLLTALLSLASPAHAEWVERVVDGIMGTRISVNLWADNTKAGNELIDAVMDDMRRIDLAMSTYRKDSEVSKVNDRATREEVVVTPELFDLLTKALEFSRMTEGAFDITYASVGYLYDFRHNVRPTDKQIHDALPGVNYRHVILDPKKRTVHFTQPGVRIDLGGIGKGHAVDSAIALLQSRGVAHALVTAGGDSRIIGDRFGQPWIIGIRHPDRKDEVIARMPLEDAAMSTSGDYERYFDEKGVRYHHIIDPKTGDSARKVRSATVIGPNATTTDGLSKTAFVLGAEKAIEIYNRIEDIDAVIVKPDGTVLYTKGLEAPK